jgi:nucleoside permease NupC
MQVLWGIGGMVVLLAIAFLLSNNRRAINPAESTFAASTIFVGMSEAPLVVKPYIERATKSELFTMMGTGEFVAFSNFGPQVEQFSQKTVAIVTFGLTGFANFGSIAILIGTFGSISPSRRHEVARFGIRAVLAGTLANLMNATIAGILIR